MAGRILCQFNKSKLNNNVLFISKFVSSYNNSFHSVLISNTILYDTSQKSTTSYLTSKHYYSNNTKEDNLNGKKILPRLMNFPEIVWPSFFKTLKNFILVTFIIRPYFDREFNLVDFTAATKHAMQVVSSKISSGDLGSLNGLVGNDAITMMQRSIAKMSVAQRSELNVLKDDIYFSFPYQIGIMFDDEETNADIQKRFVEITMVYHVLKGLKDMQERGETPPLNLGVLPEYRDKISICNYRFIKEFTKGNESNWTINVINHFKPSDYIEN